MKKGTLLFALFAVLSISLKAQTFGNEWIDYNSHYLKFPIVESKIYRIHYEALQTSLQAIGVSIETINPKTIKIYGRGEEIPIYISGESDNQFDSADFIEFYAQKNDGWFDSLLYPNNQQVNPFYSNFTDTAYYFLSWGNNNGLRYDFQTDTNFSLYNAHSHIFVERILSYANYYCTGYYQRSSFVTAYKPTEGWMDTRITLGSTSNKPIVTSNAYTTYPTAALEYAFAGVNTPSYEHHMQVTIANQTLLDTSYQGVSFIKKAENIATSLLGTSTTTLSFKSINDKGNTTCYQCPVYVKLKYAHTFTLESATSYLFSANNLVGAKSLFAFTSSTIGTASNDEIFLYGISNQLRILVKKSGNSLNAVVPNYGGDNTYFLTAKSAMGTISTLYPVSSTGRFDNPSIYKHINFFIISHSSLLTEAKQYAQYRSTESPYNYQAQAFDVQELYDQFAYGIRNNPMAIHNLIKFAYATYNNTPQYLFLFGRAYPSYNGRKTSTTFNATLVPTMGSIPSDYAITMGLGDTTAQFCVPTGRLSTSSTIQAGWYLNKVKEYETAQQTPKAWMKQILHFGGGSSAAEQNNFAVYLNRYKSIAEAPYLGATVKTFLKLTSSPIEINMSDSLRNLINNGVAMMTFFGHAGGTGFDISIDDPEEYNNYGKYFVLVGNSCYAGNIFEGSDNYSEKFIHIPNKGAIAFISPMGQGNSLVLNDLCENFYKQISYDNYGKSIGFCLQKALKYITGRYGNDKMDYPLHGDPSLIIGPATYPDYEVKAADVKTSPEVITSELDSFDLSFLYYNNGKITTDSFSISVERFYPDGTSTRQVKQVNCSTFVQNESFKFAVDKTNAIGKNRIVITIDVLNEVVEHDETNNSTSIEFNIFSSDIIPVYPQKYAIVGQKKVTLVASGEAKIEQIGKYILQIDTCDEFNSGAKYEKIEETNIGLIQWELPFECQDSMVYYWRVSKIAADTTWRESSFQYIENKSGFSQAHFYQFKDNDFLNVEANRASQSFDFKSGIYAFTAKTRFFNSLYEQSIYETEVYVKRNNVIFDVVNCVMSTRPFIHILVFDSITGEHWVNNETTYDGSVGSYGQALCRSYATNSFGFYMDNATSRQDVANFLTNLPTSSIVLIMSINHCGAHLFTESQYQAWESVGSKSVRSLTANNCYILWGRKGASLTDPNVREEIGLNNGLYTSLNGASLHVPFGNAQITTESFGPALEWGSFHWKMESLEPSIGDTSTVTIYGIDTNNVATALISNIKYPTDSNVWNLNTKINAKQYPYLRLGVNMKDNVTLTAPQVKRLQLMYEQAPETAVVLDPFAFYQDTLQQGDSIKLLISTKNVGQKDMDSLLVKYDIVFQNNIVYSFKKRLKNHPVGEVLTDTVAIGTSSFSGVCLLRAEFNPNNDQLEQYHFNNYFEKSFYVATDSINPILDVTFDGNHIIDGELVSAKPFIQMMLKDENEFLLLNELSDTSKFKVYLKTPSSTAYNRVPFMIKGVENMQFIPADARNKCHINYQAELLEDGVYTLRVEATDKSNNVSGNNAFVVDFQVTNKSTITEIFNYPNPFSTSTRFVFTLTGSMLPTFMKIQIMTISGKVVREIDMSELGSIRIGTNITQYAWDGRDQHGDLLANGIYLYRVITRIDGQDIELSAQSKDAKAFKKGFGKMVIIR